MYGATEQVQAERKRRTIGRVRQLDRRGFHCDNHGAGSRTHLRQFVHVSALRSNPGADACSGPEANISRLCTARFIVEVVATFDSSPVGPEPAAPGLDF
jgi:hypothetical protein